MDNKDKKIGLVTKDNNPMGKLKESRLVEIVSKDDNGKFFSFKTNTKSKEITLGVPVYYHTKKNQNLTNQNRIKIVLMGLNSDKMQNEALLTELCEYQVVRLKYELATIIAELTVKYNDVYNKCLENNSIFLLKGIEEAWNTKKQDLLENFNSDLKLFKTLFAAETKFTLKSEEPTLVLKKTT